jgi:hypothetical protein
MSYNAAKRRFLRGPRPYLEASQARAWDRAKEREREHVCTNPADAPCADCPGCSPDCQRGSGCCDPRNDVGEEANP